MEAIIKDKIDNPPEKKDYQKISHNLKKFIELKDAAKSNTAIKYVDNEDKPENYKNKNTNVRPTKNFSNIKMHQNETDRDYMKRVNRITRNSMMEAEFEKKYGVDVIRNEKNSVITIKKRPKDQLVELMKGKIGKKNNDKNPKEIHLSEMEKKKLIKEMLEKKKNDKLKKSNDDIVEFKKDEFIFGEVVNAPPQLSVPRKAKKSETVSRPGGKKSLLLHSILENTQSQQKHNKIVENQTTSDIVKKKNKLQSNKIDLKGKRKNLPMLARQMIETQQQDVMEMYKKLKKNKRLCTD